MIVHIDLTVKKYMNKKQESIKGIVATTINRDSAIFKDLRNHTINPLTGDLIGLHRRVLS